MWCGFWALLSKIFTRQSSFGWHVRVFVIASLAFVVLGALPPLLAFAFSWPWVTDFGFVAVYRRGGDDDLLPPARGRAGAARG